MKNILAKAILIGSALNVEEATATHLKSQVFQKLASRQGVDQKVEETIEEQSQLDSLVDLKFMAEIEADESLITQIEQKNA